MVDLPSVSEDFRIVFLQGVFTMARFVVENLHGKRSVDVEEADEEESAFWQERSVLAHVLRKFFWAMDIFKVAATPSKVTGGEVVSKMLTLVICHAFNLGSCGSYPELQPCLRLQHFLNPTQPPSEVELDDEIREMPRLQLIFLGSFKNPHERIFNSEGSKTIRSELESSNRVHFERIDNVLDVTSPWILERLDLVG
jgi:hypothetical protein